ncbi:MAG TPA: hypothetical protein VFB54_09670 [Burkholderiales bacterium]|nr:hypothetical protein [Burkholderiales bacterium]
MRFNLHPFARHNALADAVASAELFLICIDRALARGATTLGELLDLQRTQLAMRRLRQF